MDKKPQSSSARLVGVIVGLAALGLIYFVLPVSMHRTFLWLSVAFCVAVAVGAALYLSSRKKAGDRNR